MGIPRLRLMAGVVSWSVRLRASRLRDRLARALNWIPRVRIHDLETAALLVAYLAMASALLALLGVLLTGGQA